MSEAEFREDYELARRMHGALWAAGDYTRVAEQLTGAVSYTHLTLPTTPYV